MQQQPAPMFPAMPSFPPTNITTDQIQKYLDENKKLIMAILDNQNLGKLAECAQYQAQLQKNLMYLAAIADAQPQTPAIPTPQGGGGFYFQHQPPGIVPPRPPFVTSSSNLQNPFQDPQMMMQLPLQPPPQNQIPPPISIPTSSGGGNRRDKQRGPDGGGIPAATSDVGKDK